MNELYIYKRRDYMFFGHHIKKWAIGLLIFYMIDISIWYSLRIIQLVDQDVLLHGNSSVPKLIALLVPPFGRSDYLIYDALIVISNGSFLLAIIMKKSCLVQPERYINAILAVLNSINCILLFALAGALSRDDNIWEQIEEYAKHLNSNYSVLFTFGPHVYLVLAIISGISAAFSYFCYILTTRFREYLQDVEDGIAILADIPAFHL